MKPTIILIALAASAFAIQPIVPTITAKSLVDLQQRDPMLRMVKPADGEVKIARPVDQSIIQQSTLLSDGENWTLVPNGAVVFLPESKMGRVIAKPMGKLLAWKDFLTRNQGWIRTNEVSFDQAVGNEALPAECGASWQKQDKVVVAVHQQGPISVRINSLTQR